MTKVFLSKENGKVSSHTDLDMLKEKFAGIHILHNFSRDENLELLKKECKDGDSIVLAGPEPGFYEFDEGKQVIEAITSAGINRNHIVSIDLCTAVNPGNIEYNTDRALLLLSMAQKNLPVRSPFDHIDYTPEQRVLIIGSDPSGILLASQLADAGMPVTMMNRGEIPASHGWWSDEYENITKNKNFKGLPFITLKAFSGFPGNYTVEYEKSEEKGVVNCGIIVIATTTDLPYNQDIHNLFHIPIGHNKELIPISNGKLSFKTRYPQVILLPSGQQREELLDQLNFIIPQITAFLKQKTYRHFFDITSVNEETCGACGTCVKTCMFGASSIDVEKKVSAVDKFRCVGCGNCVTACPTGARELHSYPTSEIFSCISSFAKTTNSRGLIFACEGGGYPTLHGMAKLGIPLPDGFSVLKIRCGARLDTQFISEAMNNGFRGVGVVSCKESRCLNDVGSLDLSRRFNLYRAVMRAKGIDANLLRIITIEHGDTESCSQALNAFSKYLEGGNNE